MSALRRLAARLVWMVPFAALGITACEHNPASPGSLASIVIARNPETLAIGTTVQFTATGKDANGMVVGINPDWAVSAAVGGGDITGSGVFLAGTVPGTFTNTVTATVGSIVGTATVIVTAGPVASITVTPAAPTLATNTTQQYSAVGKDGSGNVTAITPNWSVTAGGGTIVSGTGLFTSGMAPGAYANTVRASVGGVSGTASVTVDATALATVTVTPNPSTLAQGAAQTFTATGKDAAGNTISPITITWSNVTAAAGSITSAGVFTAGTTAGTYNNTVTATSGSRSGTASVTVSFGAAATIVVTPAAVTLATNTTRQYTAVVKDGAGNTLATAPSWSVTAGGGSINAGTGLFTSGMAPGTYTGTVRASVGSVFGTADVTVDATALATVTVTPSPVTLAIGASQTFTATGTDASGNVISPLTFTWSNVTAAAGSFAAGTSVFTAGTTAGTYANTVTATSGGITGTASVTVGFGVAASIVVTPAAVTLATNTTRQYTAVVKDANGNTLATAPSWSVTAGGGSINAGTGLFTSGMAPGTYTGTVRASVGSVFGTADVTVDATALATVTVTPSPVTLAIGASQTFTATGKDAGGNVISPLTFTWSNVTAAAGSIAAGTSVFTAGITAGTYANTVTATSGGITGTATVVVSAGVAATIVVTPTPDTLAIGDSVQLSALIKDASGNTLSILPNWSVAAGGGTIGSTGLFTAGTVAGTYTNTATASVGSVHGSATVTVKAGAVAIITVIPNPSTLAQGAAQTFTATGKDAHGNAVAVTPTWAIVASGGGIIAGTGVFTAGNVAGVFANTVRACSTAGCGSGSVAGFATVTVNPGALASITVAPNPVTVATDASAPFTAVGRDANNNIIPITPTWSMLTGAGLAGGTILSPSGVYTAPTLAGSGIDSVRACSTALCLAGSIKGFARVNVTASLGLVSIVVTPNPASVTSTLTQQFTATGYDAANTIVPTPGLAWSVVASQSAAGTIGGGTGLLTAGAIAGTYPNAIQATSGGISGFASVTVTPLQIGPSLGAAATHGILAGTAVTCAGAPGTINADASVWPGSSFSGFPPCTITGAQHAADLFAQTAQGDLTTAFLALQGMACGTTITADLGGTTLAEGVYCSATSIGVTGTVTLTGNANSLFVFQAGSSLTTAGNVVMAGGALAKNVYWVVNTSATIGTASAWLGNILALTSITLVDNATLTGRALARNGAVSLGTGNVITLP